MDSPRPARRPLRTFLAFVGALALAWLIFCLTPLCGRALRALETDPHPPDFTHPEVIVVLGGGGIPSKTGLLRCYLGAVMAKRHPDAEVIVSLPADGNPETSAVGRMRDELVLRGIDRTRIRMETEGIGTHAQARAVAAMLTDSPGVPVLLVTSEFHMRRAVLSFRKAGLNVTTVPGESPAPENNMGSHLHWRYYVWDNFANSFTLAREWLAIAWYKLRGRI
jgi:uncharacterized SAM-binding protein YcdF (DUF218 family)